MSIWGATVITNLLSAIPYLGKDLVIFVWGGFSVGNPTLNRFFSLHYLLPFVLLALMFLHLMSLHEHGFKGPKFIKKSWWLNLSIQKYWLLSLSTNKSFYHSFSKLSFILPNIRSNKRIGPHNIDIYSFLFGSLLGDCTAERLKSGGVRFRFKQSIIHKNYLFFIYYFLLERGYVNNNLPSLQKDKYGLSYRFNTYSFSNLLWFYKLFYKNKVKVLPSLDYLFLFLTPLALAIWIMDDGIFKKPGLRIAINSFTKKEGELLIKFLKLKYNINSSLHKNNNQFQLYIQKDSMDLLINIVKPYFHSSMYYKLGLNF